MSLLIALLAAIAPAQQAGPQTAAAERVSLPLTEVRTLHSNVVGVDYLLYVSLPATYATSHVTYPVLYATDGNRSFSLYAGMSQIMTLPQPGYPEWVTISIGYPDEGMPFGAAWAAGRTRDLTPTNVAAEDRAWSARLERLVGRTVPVRTGGSASFLRFIREELIPWAEANYRVSSTDRALAGYSYGGLFTLYALFHSPGTFQRCFAGSPSIEYDDAVLFREEAESASSRRDLPVRLFMSVGGLEDEATRQNMERMAERLRAHRYPSLELETHVFEGETHRSCYAAAISRALTVFYAPGRRPQGAR